MNKTLSILFSLLCSHCTGNICSIRSVIMGGHHPKLIGPSPIKEIVLAIIIGTACGFGWKRFQWEQQSRTRQFYEALERGDISVVPEE
ncbi:hypothetical protein Leryth_005571 [Lithospermum erythrorhizon]|nr:hypothetical protein Leryth_005571 [Lithospermum erythrorhizon]